jgi:hypothetical protein
MPEADQEGERYALDQPQQTPGFYLKGSHQLDWGMKNRMARVFDPTSGRILLDETPMENVDVEQWRSRIGLVLQGSPLLYGNILQNIAFGDIKPNVKKAIACAGLTILAEHAKDPVRGQRSRDRAEALLSAMLTGYLTPLGNDDRRPHGMLLHGCYNKNAGWHTDHELIWGDHYLFEALRAWARLR